SIARCLPPAVASRLHVPPPGGAPTGIPASSPLLPPIFLRRQLTSGAPVQIAQALTNPEPMPFCGLREPAVTFGVSRTERMQPVMTTEFLARQGPALTRRMKSTYIDPLIQSKTPPSLPHSEPLCSCLRVHPPQGQY